MRNLKVSYTEKSQNSVDFVERWSDELDEYYDSDRILHRILVKAFLNGVEVVSALLEYSTYLDEHSEDVIDSENCMDVAYLETIYVEKAYRGQGIGTALLKNCLEKCKALGLRPSVVLAPDNLRAKAWYEDIGYDISCDSYWNCVDQGFGVYLVRLSDM